MNRGWLLCALLCCFSSIGLKAQSVTPTRIVVIPKQTTLSTPQTINLTLGVPELIGLTYEQNDFYVYFRVAGLSPPFVYRLKDGYVDYEVSTANQYAFFTHIPSGEYTFTVLWPVSRPELISPPLRIRIESPLWLRWWFMPMLFLYGLMIMGVIFYFLYRYRVKQFMLLHTVRENIARDLHDDMGSYLSSISIMSQSVVNLAKTDPKRAHSLVQKIGETARQVMDSMGDIIWSVNPDNDSMTQIVVRMRDVGADLLEGQDVVFNLDLNENLLQSHLPLEQRRDFFLIYKESLTNIAKYARASHVWVRLKRSDSLLWLTIQDDGIGFDPAQPVGQNPLGGNGLKNMRARAEKMGGTLTILSAPGEGTTVKLQIIIS